MAVDTRLEPTGNRPAADADARIWDLAAEVCDPEIPVLTIADLGILRAAAISDDGTAIVVITPTYSGCPAMGTISDDVRSALESAGFERNEVRTVLQPSWTTDWMSEDGRAKLREYGITPPSGNAPVRGAGGPIGLSLSVKCPQCDSLDTKEITRFGSTACKALYQCRSCLEPFDYFKVL